MQSGNFDKYLAVPERRSGVFFHIGLVLVFLGFGGFGLYSLSRAQIGPVFLVYLLPVVLALVIIPLLLYQIYALQTAYYILSRDGLQMRWGLRNEIIPITEVIGIGAENDLHSVPPRPFVHLPGAVLGRRTLPGPARPGEPGVVEYLASGLHGLVYVGTRSRLYAITPSDPAEFLAAFSRFMELGSLSPLPAKSVFPSVLAYRLWTNRPIRIMFLSSLALSVSLLVWVSLAIPGRPTLHLRFESGAAARDLVPGVRLLLLPLLNGIFVLVDWLVGLALFRRAQTQELAFLVWGAAVAIPILFSAAAYFILQVG